MCSRVNKKCTVGIDGSSWEAGRYKLGEGIWAGVGSNSRA